MSEELVIQAPTDEAAQGEQPCCGEPVAGEHEPDYSLGIQYTGAIDDRGNGLGATP